MGTRRALRARAGEGAVSHATGERVTDLLQPFAMSRPQWRARNRSRVVRCEPSDRAQVREAARVPVDLPEKKPDDHATYARLGAPIEEGAPERYGEKATMHVGTSCEGVSRIGSLR
jgi:hypothetical protein